MTDGCYSSGRTFCTRLSVLTFFFKQKTAYEMRISDWSPDVCSSDLETGEWAGPGHLRATAAMILSESAAGPPPTDPHDPEEVIDLFPAFNARRAGVGLLVDSQNTLGPVHWRRAKIGTTTCVLFLQRWDGAGQIGRAHV